MIQTISIPSSNPNSESGTRHPAPWAPLARHAIRRLQADLAQKLTPAWDPALDPEDMDLPELLEAAMQAPGSSAIAALNSSSSAQNVSPEEFDAIADAGGDPTATASNGSSQPRIRLPASKLIPLLRLVATIDAVRDRDAMLAPGAITVITGVPDDMLDQLKKLLTHILPANWSVATSLKYGTQSQDCLITLSPDVSDGKISRYAQTAFERDLVVAIDRQAPLLVLLPMAAAATAPTVLANPLVSRKAFAPLDSEILIMALRATHSATGRIDEAAVRAALPNDATLAELDALALTLAMRAPVAKAVAEQIAAMTTGPQRSAADGPWLEDIHGDTPALRAARQIVRDLRMWKKGEIGWADLTRTLLLYGPPGTGKSWIARAMGNSAGFSVVSGTFGEWQAAGHLGDMLREMRRTFREARAKTPTVLIIDEIDAVGSREDPEQHNRSYRTQVINAFLAEMDAIAREEGVIVIGTCNHPQFIDPAVLRAGRFDMKVALPLPDADTLFGVLRHCLPDWREADLRDLAARAVGCSAADVDAAIRQTRAMARGQKRNMSLDDLRKVFRIMHDPAIDRRVALHECGHAIVCAALDLGPVRRVYLDRDGGGGTVFDTTAKHGILSDMQDRLAQLLAGRAAERLVLGDVSAGAGGSADSDLAQATMIATSIQTRYGLGAHGPVWTADPETLIALDPNVLFRVRRELETAEKRAAQILTIHRNLLEEMAEALMASRDMDRAEVQDWLARLRHAAPGADHDARSAQQPQ